jgi:hypothetical protein
LRVLEREFGKSEKLPGSWGSQDFGTFLNFKNSIFKYPCRPCEVQPFYMSVTVCTVSAMESAPEWKNRRFFKSGKYTYNADITYFKALLIGLSVFLGYNEKIAHSNN